MNTELIFLLDESTSMGPLRDETIAGFNQMVDHQREQPGECRLTLATFATNWQYRLRNVALAHAPRLTRESYTPGGWTALLDAMGDVMNEQARRVSHERWADLVTFVVTTDGEENRSRRYTRRRIAQMVKHAEAFNWQFIFSGANIDSFAEANSLGIPSINTMNYAATAAGTASNFATMSESIAAYRSGGRP